MVEEDKPYNLVWEGDKDVAITGRTLFGRILSLSRNLLPGGLPNPAYVWNVSLLHYCTRYLEEEPASIGREYVVLAENLSGYGRTNCKVSTPS